MRPWRRSITGISGRRGVHVAAPVTLLLLLIGLGAPVPARAQTLKLQSLHLPAQDLVGTWVGFHGRSQSKGSAPREFNQRLAVVGKENLGHNRWGLWVELKTTDSRGTTRLEKGLFASPSLRGKDLLGGGTLPESDQKDDADIEHPKDEPADEESDDQDLVLVRYQAMSGAKLYEYPVGAGRHARSGGEVSTYELFEYDPTVTPVRATLGPDTLRLGRRVVPATLERVRRYGTDEWPSSEDSTGLQRLVLTQTFWKNASVPLTGYARSFFKAEMRHLPWNTTVDSLLSGIPRATRPDSTLLAAAQHVAAQADSLLKDDMGASAAAPTPATLAWTDLTLTDLGADAKPEINQLPELAPDLDESEDPSGFQR